MSDANKTHLLIRHSFRFLHRPTVQSWLDHYHHQDTPLLPAREAIVLMVLATAAFLKADRRMDEDHETNWQFSEPYFRDAQVKLASETGKLRIESVQARLAMCLYLLHTSRPNQAWYTLGITSQLIFALGMHRARAVTAPQLDAITGECRKRAFWAAFALDTWLGCILGRPALIHIDDVDQDFPAAVDDDEITAEGIVKSGLRRDPVIQGSIYLARLTWIGKKATREQYLVQRHQDSHRLYTATRLNADLADWKASLPVILSGDIHPSSLIQIFQRQIVVLQLGHSLVSMLINRPLLLVETSGVEVHECMRMCLSAAKTVLDIVIGFVSDRKTFPAFWYTQYVTFNALSIVYIWLILRRRGRLSTLDLPNSDEELYQLAQTIQKHLSAATASNAPSLRYSIVLEELQQEARRLMTRASHGRPPHVSGLIEAPTESHPYATPSKTGEPSPLSQSTGSSSWGSVSDFPIDNNLWAQLDAYPFTDLDFEQLVG